MASTNLGLAQYLDSTNYGTAPPQLAPGHQWAGQSSRPYEYWSLLQEQTNGGTLDAILAALGGGGGGGNPAVTVRNPSAFFPASLGQTEVGAVYNPAPCILNGFNVVNPNAYPVYLKLYDTAVVPTDLSIVKTTIMIPANGTVFIAANKLYSFMTGIAARATELLADGDDTGIALPLIMDLTFTNN